MGSKQGNLMLNGSFELGLVAWENENVLAVKGNSHTGSYKAVLGGTNQLQASLTQDIKVSRKRIYFLCLFASATGTAGDVHIKLEWLNKRGAKLGIGLNFDIPGRSISPQPIWTFYIDITGKSPDEARFGRLTISKDLGGFVDLDDIMFYEQGGN